MARSIWKGPYVGTQFRKKKDLFISRNSEIVPVFLGATFKVHNGQKYTDILVTENMIGHKFGEFSFTRAVFTFKKKSKKK